jgi:ATP-dependent helicase IRC3
MYYDIVISPTLAATTIVSTYIDRRSFSTPPNSFAPLAFSHHQNLNQGSGAIPASPCAMLRTIARCLSRPAPWPAPRTAPLSIARATYATLEPNNGTSKLQLRDYQLQCIKSVLSALKRGHKRVGISLATGSGKTVGLIRLVLRFAPLI